MKTRNATLDDLDALWSLFKQVDNVHAALVPEIFQPFEGPARSAVYLQNFINHDDSVVIVVEHADTIIGLLSLMKTCNPPYPMFRPHPYVMIDTLVVDEGYLRQGVGSMLLEGAKEWARKHGVRFIQTTVWTANANAVDFYTKHAFNTLTKRMELEIDIENK